MSFLTRLSFLYSWFSMTIALFGGCCLCKMSLYTCFYVEQCSVLIWHIVYATWSCCFSSLVFLRVVVSYWFYLTWWCLIWLVALMRHVVFIVVFVVCTSYRFHTCNLCSHFKTCHFSGDISYDMSFYFTAMFL